MTERQVTWRTTSKKSIKEGINGTVRKAPEMGPDWFAFVEVGEDPTSANGFMNVRYVHAAQVQEVLIQCKGEAITEQQAMMDEADGKAAPKAEKKAPSKATAKG